VTVFPILDLLRLRLVYFDCDAEVLATVPWESLGWREKLKRLQWCQSWVCISALILTDLSHCFVCWTPEAVASWRAVWVMTPWRLPCTAVGFLTECLRGAECPAPASGWGCFSYCYCRPWCTQKTLLWSKFQQSPLENFATMTFTMFKNSSREGSKTEQKWVWTVGWNGASHLVPRLDHLTLYRNSSTLKGKCFEP
jgi:hypothetical protein